MDTIFECIAGVLVLELFYSVVKHLGLVRMAPFTSRLPKSLIFGIAFGVGVSISETFLLSQNSSILCIGAIVLVAEFTEFAVTRWFFKAERN
jgi:uncharacterized membrane protein